MTSVVLEEIPDRVSLAVDISNCRGNCVGCHSPFLKLDIGEELTPEIADALIADNFGVNCFLFLGEGRDPEALLALAAHIRSAHPALELALYSGREEYARMPNKLIMKYKKHNCFYYNMKKYLFFVLCGDSRVVRTTRWPIFVIN